MRKHTIPMIALAICAHLALQAQSFHSQACSHDFWMSSLQVHHPDQFAFYGARYTEALNQSKASGPRNAEPLYTLPVVVHIVWREEQEYLSDERIHAQLARLNEDFSSAYQSSGLLRPAFEAVAGDPKIEFELVHIERVQTDRTFQLDIDWANFKLVYPDEVKNSAQGGSDAWAPQQYLNIWVCGIHEDQLLGYSYPPSGFNQWPGGLQAPSESTDGIVINYKAFGAPPPPIVAPNGSSYQPLGHTLTHEVGHYLGLQHPWGIEEFSNQACEADDGLEDTPLVAGPYAFECNHQLNSCMESSMDLPDMIENFMDYSAESCRTAFTHGQIQLMHYVLDKYRPQLRQKSIEINPRTPLKLYPNPTQGSVQVFVNPAFEENYQLTVVGANSRELQLPISYYPSSQFAQYQLDLSDLPNGVYFIQLRSAVRRLSKRIVLMR